MKTRPPCRKPPCPKPPCPKPPCPKPPCPKPWPPRHACPGTALVTSSATSITPIPIHFCLMPIALYPLHIAITSLGSPCCGAVRHPIPRHGERCKGNTGSRRLCPCITLSGRVLCSKNSLYTRFP